MEDQPAEARCCEERVARFRVDDLDQKPRVVGGRGVQPACRGVAGRVGSLGLPLGRRLAFDVVRSPSPLRELSPYSNVSPPHLDGSLRSRRGEFRLVPLPNGRTRLEGRTWYELEMAPEGYWQLLADYLVHRIHDRVLNHIKREVERGG